MVDHRLIKIILWLIITTPAIVNNIQVILLKVVNDNVWPRLFLILERQILGKVHHRDFLLQINSIHNLVNNSLADIVSAVVG